jgi:hypothetical protein
MDPDMNLVTRLSSSIVELQVYRQVQACEPFGGLICGHQERDLWVKVTVPRTPEQIWYGASKHYSHF